jgi:hypothetical protein
VQPLRPRHPQRYPIQRFETEPGEQLQFDWGEFRYTRADHTHKLYGFTAILSYSRMRFVVLTDVPPLPSLHADAPDRDATQDQLALALLSLTMFPDYGVTRAWKSLDWDVMDRLYAHGWIHDPKGRPNRSCLRRKGKPMHVHQ